MSEEKNPDPVTFSSDHYRVDGYEKLKELLDKNEAKLVLAAVLQKVQIEGKEIFGIGVILNGAISHDDAIARQVSIDIAKVINSALEKIKEIQHKRGRDN